MHKIKTCDLEHIFFISDLRTNIHGLIYCFYSLLPLYLQVSKYSKMESTMKKMVILIFFVIFSYSFAYSQSTEHILFDQGVKFYLDKNYEAAQSTFLKLSSEFPDSPLASATYYMLMRTQYQLKKYALAEASGHLLLKKYPFSKYKDDVYYWLGNIKFQMKQYQKGVLYWLLAFKYTDDSRLKKRLSRYLNKAMTSILTEEELNNLATKVDDTNLKILVNISFARKLIQNRKYSEAYGILKKIKTEHPNNPFTNVVESILSDIPFENIISGKYILVSVPRGEGVGGLGQIGEHFTEGFKFALEEHKMLFPNSDVKALFINDSNSVVKSIPSILNVLGRYDVWVNVGSLTNEMTANLELISKYNGIVHIAPTANHANLKKIYDKYIQINPDAFTKGVTLATYAKQNLKHHTIAMLAPDDEYGKMFVHGFQSVWQDSDSVSYLDIEYFSPEAKKFMQQLSKIRYLAQLKMFTDSISQVQPDLSEEEILSMYQVWLDEKVTKLKEELMKNVDSLDIPMDNIDLFVAAIYPDQVQAFSSQFAFFNFQTQLIGNEGWYNPEELDKVNSSYINNLIFITPIFIQNESWEYKNFKNKFRIKLKKTPDKFHLLGYNLGKWISEHLDLADSKDKLMDYLLQDNTSNLIGMQIIFPDDSNANINHFLNFVQFKYGKFFQLK